MKTYDGQDHGKIDWKGNVITIMQQPYVKDDGFGYTAMGEDDNGEEYKIEWAVDGDQEGEVDESSVCDWTRPRIKKLT